MNPALRLNNLFNVQTRFKTSSSKSRKLGGAVFNPPNQDSVKCTICAKQFAKYTCPNCNVRYCSVNCFRSVAHVTCSESFYRNALIEDVKLDAPLNSGHQDANHTQATEMLEVLKRVNDRGISSDDEVGDGDDEEMWNPSEDGLNNMTQDELLGLLSQAQIDEFHRKLLDRQIEPEFVQATINSQFRDPWWIDYPMSSLNAAERKSSNLHHSREIELIDSSLLPDLAGQLHPELPYHLFSLLLGYVALIRYYGLRNVKEIVEDHDDRVDIFGGFPKFFPVLFNIEARPKSISDGFSLLMKNSSSINPESIPFLMNDLEKIFLDDQQLPKSKPVNKVTVLEDNPSEENRLDVRVNFCTLALSDLYSAIKSIQDHNLSRSLKINLRHGCKPILRKLLYFISFISIKSSQALLDGLLQEIKYGNLGSDNWNTCTEAIDDEQAQPSRFLIKNESHALSSTDLGDVIKKPKIVEVSCSNHSNEREGE